VFILTRPVKYSWSDFSNRFGEYVGEFGLYDLKKHTTECTYPDRKITDKYNVLFNHKNNDTITYMLKLASLNAKGKENDIIEYIKPLVKKYEYNNLIVRIQTNPWRNAPHFDAMDQVAYMLDGEKRWLFWNVDFKDTSEALSFRDDINNLDYEQMELYLQTKNIPYEKKRMKPLDTFFITRGTWHYVENINKTVGCIMLNVHLKKESEHIDKKFKELWPIQHERCMNNTYY
jgi:hypothetical protein